MAIQGHREFSEEASPSLPKQGFLSFFVSCCRFSFIYFSSQAFSLWRGHTSIKPPRPQLRHSTYFLLKSFIF